MFFKDSLKFHETLSSFSKLYGKLSRKFGRQRGSKHELVQRVYHRLAFFFSLFPVPGGRGVTGGVCDSASARTRSRDILFELTL